MMLEKDKIKSDEFVSYLKNKLDNQVFCFLELLNEKTDLLIFSGVIRDFALGYTGPIRDLDLVVKKGFDDLNLLFENLFLNFKRNSFGGYKIQINDIKIDIWDIENTWAFREKKLNPEIFTEYSLPKTCFFNFSSIIFNVKTKQFIQTKHFNDFLDNRMLDIVFTDNPYPELCIINTFYYKEKFDLKISNKLKQYINKNFDNISKKKFEEIQLKHFEHLMFSYDTLQNKVANLKKSERV